MTERLEVTSKKLICKTPEVEVLRLGILFPERDGYRHRTTFLATVYRLEEGTAYLTLLDLDTERYARNIGWIDTRGGYEGCDSYDTSTDAEGRVTHPRMYDELDPSFANLVDNFFEELKEKAGDEYNFELGRI